MACKKTTRKKFKLPKKIPKLPNINVNIDGKKAILRQKNGKTTASYGDYKGSVTQKGKDININFRKKKKGLLERLF